MNDRNAFVEQMEAIRPRITERLTRRFSDAQLAEECTWEALVKAFETQQSNPDTFYAEGASLEGWVYRRASWRIVDELRYRERFQSIEGLKEDDWLQTTADTVDTSTEDTLRDCMAALGEQERSILASYHFDGMTDQEIGTALYGEEGTAQNRGLKVWRMRQRVYGRMRKLMGDEYAPVGCQLV